MNPIFKKMNFKDQKRILVLFAPISFQPNMAEMEPLCEVLTEIRAADKYEYVLTFAESIKQLEETMASLKGKFSENDPQLWIAYPKKSSKKYQSDINRDMDWSFVGEQGFEGVRQIAIDADWSALRFRQARFIKTMKRNPKMAISEEGKKKLQ
ncbi:MAG: hypothetical protein AAF927_25860 [Bacteroidota bacterium]